MCLATEDGVKSFDITIRRMEEVFLRHVSNSQGMPRALQRLVGLFKTEGKSVKLASELMAQKSIFSRSCLLMIKIIGGSIKGSMATETD